MSHSIHTLKVAVIGVGSMGRHHARICASSPGVLLAGVCDPDPERARNIAETYGCRVFRHVDEAIESAEAVCVAAPTSLHHEIGTRCLSLGRHALMEKPLTADVASARALRDLAREKKRILMVGHIERYNPAVTKLFEMLAVSGERVISVDACRMTPFDGGRCLDVDVLLDLMIHDMDLVLEAAGSQVREVFAVARPVFSRAHDLAYAVLSFENGCIASIQTGKCSPEKRRVLTVSTRRMRLVADTLHKTLCVYSAGEPSEDGSMKGIEVCEAQVSNEEPLRVELNDFFTAVREGRPGVVDADRAVGALEALERVRAAI